MEFKGEKGERVYTLYVEKGKVCSILVEIKNTWERKFYQRGPVKLGLAMDEKIFEEAVLAICKKSLFSWLYLLDAVWNDKIYGEDLLQKIFEKHLN